ncbi:MAG: hypothetical protein HY956_05830, partial [Deltaproteobacteria bacterium]|nr:hypothetical protein [Deltaproteobacteria bacterium]
LSLVSAVKEGGRWAVKWVESTPSGGTDDGLKGAVTGLLRGFGSKGPLFISIPDSSAECLIMDFKGLPSKDSDTLAVVKLRAAKELFLRPDDYSASYQAISNGGGVRVFAVLARSSYIRSIEEGAKDAGAEVKTIRPHSVSLLNLLSERNVPERDFVIALRLEGSFATLFFKDGTLDFYRQKPLAKGDPYRELKATFVSYGGMRQGQNLEKVFVLSTDTAFTDAVKRAVDNLPVEEMRSVDFLTGEVPGDWLSIASALGSSL